MKLQPTQSYLLLSLHEATETSLVLLEGSDLQPFAFVQAIGPDVKDYAIGDKVLCNPSLAVYADKIDGKRMMIVSSSSIFARYVDTTTLN